MDFIMWVHIQIGTGCHDADYLPLYQPFCEFRVFHLFTDICNDAFLVSGAEMEDMRNRLKITVNAVESHYFDDDACRKPADIFHFCQIVITGCNISNGNTDFV